MKTLVERADYMHAAGYVTRYHAHRTVQQNTVGQHTYGVLVYLFLLAGPDAALLVAGLGHDMAENTTGDVPGTVKKAAPEIKRVFDAMEDEAAQLYGLPGSELTAWGLWVLKMADNLEGMRFCVQERQMGNQLIEPVYLNYRDWVATSFDKLEGMPEIEDGVADRARQLFNSLKEKWRKAHG